MNNSWKTESGQLACKWSHVGEEFLYSPPMNESSGSHGSYLEPVPDFAAHSPFGGPSWFDPRYRMPRS